MNIEIEPCGRGVAIVRPTGTLDMQTATELKQCLVRAAGEGSKRLVVDLERVPMLDSSGLAALIAGLKTARQMGGDLRLSSPSAQVRYVLRLAGLDRVLACSETTAEAVGRVGEHHREIIVLSADPNELRRVRGALARLSVAAQLARPGAENIVRTSFSTAVLEIATAVLAQAGPPGAAGALAVELILHHNELEAVIEDGGQVANGTDRSQNGHSSHAPSPFDLAARSVDSFEFERLAWDAKRWRLRQSLEARPDVFQPAHHGPITLPPPTSWPQQQEGFESSDLAAA